MMNEQDEKILLDELSSTIQADLQSGAQEVMTSLDLLEAPFSKSIEELNRLKETNPHSSVAEVHGLETNLRNLARDLLREFDFRKTAIYNLRKSSAEKYDRRKDIVYGMMKNKTETISRAHLELIATIPEIDPVISSRGARFLAAIAPEQNSYGIQSKVINKHFLSSFREYDDRIDTFATRCDLSLKQYEQRKQSIVDALNESTDVLNSRFKSTVEQLRIAMLTFIKDTGEFDKFFSAMVVDLNENQAKFEELFDRLAESYRINFESIMNAGI